MLTDNERIYLDSVISPKSIYKKIKYIKKCKHYNKCYISICLVGLEDISLPFFEEKEMYIGMEVNKEYTLRELGLKKEKYTIG